MGAQSVTNFVGISMGAINDRLCVIATSQGVSVIKPEGLTTRECIAFLWTIGARDQRSEVRGQKEKPAVALVCYNASVDFEMLLRDLSPWDKDKLFGIWRTKEDNNKDLPIYDAGRGAESVDFEGFRLYQLPGKLMRLSIPRRRGMVIFDIASYFDSAEIGEAAKEYLDAETRRRGDAELKAVEKNLMALWRDGLHDQIVTRCETEAKLIVKLAEKVESTIDPLNLQPRQWYGPSAIASRCLAKWRARGQAKRLTESNTAHDLLRAIDCAYIGGRVEAVKLGTVKDVRLFDLNSAYAYAVTRLSQFYKPLRFTRNPVQHVRVPFSCWLVSYELPESATIGCMPQRAPGGQMSFRRRGKTWAWQPEVEYLAKHYPGCFQIHYGYVATAAKEGRKLWRSEREDKTGQPVTFGPKVSEMYDYRMALRAQGDAGEKIVKLALSNLYGKFAQNTGGAYYQCRAWAGWITSQVRRMLLDAITGIEDRVICFSQDAVHIEGADANVQIGDGLGEWKRSVYASGLYLAPGIYELTEQAADGRPQTAGKDKTATRGANLDLDFARMARELSGHQVTQLERAFVVGWALARQGAVRYESDYLQEISESLQLIPGRLRARNYAAQFDWLKENRSSEINQGCSGRESSRYLPQAGSGALRLRLKDRGWA